MESLRVVSLLTAKNKSAEIIELTNQGMKPSEIAKKLGIGVASLYHHRVA